MSVPRVDRLYAARCEADDAMKPKTRSASQVEGQLMESTSTGTEALSASGNVALMRETKWT
jgi:hypothetical protein